MKGSCSNSFKVCNNLNYNCVTLIVSNSKLGCEHLLMNKAKAMKKSAGSKVKILGGKSIS